MIYRPPFPPRPDFPVGWAKLALAFSAGALGHYLWKFGRDYYKKIQESMARQENKSKTSSSHQTQGGTAPTMNTTPDKQPTYTSDEPFPFGQMQNNFGGTSEIALKSVAVSGEVHGLLFSSTTTQVYKNETNDPLEVIYTFPLAWDTALLGLSATIGEKHLTGQVVQKKQAEQQYEEAVSKGDSAIMVQQSAEGLYTANLGNIKPGETVSVELHCTRLLRFEQNRIRICIPTVIGERYGDPYAQGGLAPHESAKTDPSAHYPCSVRIALYGEIAKGNVSCPSHGIQAKMVENGIVFETGSTSALDRDFVLLVEDISGHSYAQCVVHEDETLVAASFCPKIEQKDDSPLALKILVDCSGSMCGERIAQAKRGLLEVLNQLSSRDYLSYSRFGSRVENLSNDMVVACDQQCIESFKNIVSKTDANMGGTEMEKALLDTFRIKVPEGIPSAVLVITDGDVWAVKNVIRAAKDSGQRVFAIGVGSAPAESLLRELAAQTGGACDFVTSHENMAQAVLRMFHRMRGSVARNVHINWHGETLWESRTPQFLYDGETVHSFAVLKSQPYTAPVLRWEADDGDHASSADHIEKLDSEDLFRIGMVKKIVESNSQEEIENIGIKYQLVSEYTSLILVYEREENDKIEGLPKIQQVPQMPAYGHGCNGNYQGYNYQGCDLYIENFLAPTVDISELNSFSTENSSTEIKNFAQKILIRWKENVFKCNSVLDSMSFILNDYQFDYLLNFLNELESRIGKSREITWAIFIQCLIERYGHTLSSNRHSNRIIQRALSSLSSEELSNAKKTCFQYF